MFGLFSLLLLLLFLLFLQSKHKIAEPNILCQYKIRTTTKQIKATTTTCRTGNKDNKVKSAKTKAKGIKRNKRTETETEASAPPKCMSRKSPSRMPCRGRGKEVIAAHAPAWRISHGGEVPRSMGHVGDGGHRLGRHDKSMP